MNARRRPRPLIVLAALFLAFRWGDAAAQTAATLNRPLRTIAIDERLAHDHTLRVGDSVAVTSDDGLRTDSAVIGAITRRGTDPSEVARNEYHVRFHLDQLQRLSGYGDRVDRFAIRTVGGVAGDSARREIAASAFGFRAFRSSDIAVESSRTFQVVSRFHRAIGVISIAASAIFLLCIMLLRIDERRREIAALRLIGISRRSIVRMIAIEATGVAIAGSLLGLVLGLVTTAIVDRHYQAVYQTPMRFSIVTPGIATFAIGLSILLGASAGLIAGWRLVRIPPLDLLGR